MGLAVLPGQTFLTSAEHGMDRTVARNQVILVDEWDRPIGVEEKLAVHQNGGRLHRAFSVFIFNSDGQMLLQRRAASKYHFGGLWSNACCSHPHPGEEIADAARARMTEELGIHVPLRPAFTFTYRCADPASGLTEHEFDHVFTGSFDGDPRPNPNEVDDWRWEFPDQLIADVSAHPDRYTPWFTICLPRVLALAEHR